MAIDWQGIFNGKGVIALANFIGRALPPRAGYRAADWIADRISSFRILKITRAVRANQWVARGESLAGKALDQAVRETFQYSACSVFDLYRYLQHPAAALEAIDMDPTFRRLSGR